MKLKNRSYQIALASLILLFASTLARAETRHRSDFADLPDQKTGGLTLDPNPDATNSARKSQSSGPTKIDQLAPGARKGCEQKHTFGAFLKMGLIRNLQASAQGGLYYLIDAGQAPQLYYQATAKTVSKKQVTNLPTGVSDYRLSPNGRHLAILAPLANAKTSNPSTQIFILNPQKSDLKTIKFNRPAQVESVAWSVDSTVLFFTANLRSDQDFDLYQYRLKGAEIELLTTLKGLNQITDVAPNGLKIALCNRRTHYDSDLKIWDLKEKNWISVSSLSGEVLNQKAVFAADSKHLLFLSNHTGDFNQLTWVDLARSDNQVALTSAKHDIESFVFNSDRTAAALIENDEGYGHISSFQIANDGRKNDTLLLPDEGLTVVDGLSFGIKDPGIFYSSSESTNPSTLWQVQYPKKIAWTPAMDAQKSDCFTAAELVHYSSFDGRQISGFLYRERNKNFSERPLILYAHDGPEDQFKPRFNPLIQYWIERGYNLFAPNVRGSSGYGKSFAILDDTLHRPDAVKDFVAASKWLLNTHQAARQAMVGFGIGYGGYLVHKALESEENLLMAAATTEPLLNLENYVRNAPTYFKEDREREFGVASADWLASLSVKANAAPTSVPCLDLKAGAVSAPSEYASLPQAKTIAYFLLNYVKEKGL